MLWDHFGRNKVGSNYDKREPATEKQGFKHGLLYYYNNPDKEDKSHVTPVERKDRKGRVIPADYEVPLFIVPNAKELCTSEYGVKIKADLIPDKTGTKNVAIIVAEKFLNNTVESCAVLTYLTCCILCDEYESRHDNKVAAMIRTLQETENLYFLFGRSKVMKAIKKGTEPLRHSDVRAVKYNWKTSEKHIIGDSGYVEDGEDEDGYDDDDFVEEVVVEEPTPRRKRAGRPITT